MIVDIINWMVTIIENVGYFGVFISMFIESFFAPIPSELVLPFAGFITSKGGMSLPIVIIVAGVASSLGSLPFYFLGYWGNDLVLNRFINKYGKYLFISQEDVKKGVDFFNKHGSGIVLTGRLIPIIRTVISFPAGLTKMPLPKFLTYTLIGSTLWSGLLSILGYYLGSNWVIVEEWIATYQNLIIVVGAAFVLVYILYKLREKSKLSLFK